MGGDLADVRLWAGELEAVHGRFVHRFSRSEPRESALAYMRGLIAPLQRKNGWTLAEEAGHAGPGRIHRMLNRIEWDADEVLDDVRRYVVDNLGDPGAVLVVDDTGFLKKGTRSAGVQRQYSGTAGRTENCQVGVFLAYATDRGRTLIDRRLYLPTSWTDDPERCRRAGIGDEVAFETKVAMAKAMVRRAIADKVPFRWVTADAAYGFSKGWRSELERADVFHVMATTRHDTVVTRWAIDHPVHSAKQECGLDDYQVRRHPGWHRHMTLAMAAHACLTVLRARELDTGKAETDPPSSSTSASPRYES
ncbi:IS701 family transposase [Streptomyces sp. NPDC018026]|uniref:IS701 family transposase n=1 Tax=Streptomyces sp. NPDC018026 TaxID=3365031 RepID=UPI003799786B